LLPKVASGVRGASVIKFAGQVFVAGEYSSEPDKCTHDGNVHLHGTLTSQNAGKHCDALSRKPGSLEA